MMGLRQSFLTMGLVLGLLGGVQAAGGGSGPAACGAGNKPGEGACKARNLVSQEDFDRARQALEQAGFGPEEKGPSPIEQERETVERIESRTRSRVGEIETRALPDRVASFTDEQAKASDQALSDLSGPASDVPERRHVLLISESIPKAQRQSLLREAARQAEQRPEAKIGVYLRGPLEGQDIADTVRTVHGWLQDADLEPGSVPIGFDSNPYDEHDVEVAPTWISLQGEEVTARASGVGDLDWILERAAEPDAGPDQGQRGNVWAVQEPHFVDDYIKGRIRAWIEEEGGEEAMMARGAKQVWQHQDYHDLEVRPAARPYRYEVDPSVTATETIRGPHGKRTIARKGQTFNPLDVTPWTRPLIMFDPTREAEIAWLEGWLDRHEDARPILIASQLPEDAPGDAYRSLNRRLTSQVYLLQKDLQQRLGLQRTPSVVTATDAGRKLQVREIRVDDERLGLRSGYRRLATQILKGLLPAAQAAEGAPGAPPPEPPPAVPEGDVSVGPDTEGAEDAPGTRNPTCPNAAIFTRMFTDICWDCHLPFAMFGEDLGGDAPPGYNQSPICMCRPPWPGLSMGIWLPDRLVEVVRQPFCSPSMFGMDVDVGIGAGKDKQGGSEEGGGRSGEDKTFRHYHIWAFPVTEILGLLLGCGGGADSLSMMFMSELDPSWNNDQVAAITTPEVALFANPLAQAACVAESTALVAGSRPINAMFWCAGSWGSLYPFAGNINTQASPIVDSSLLATRALASLHRRGQMRDLVGDPCQAQMAPMLPKTNYKWSHYYPVAEKNNTHWTGEAGLRWGEHRQIPVVGEDHVELLWRWTDCCLEI